jgi:hypothetical protein
MLFSVSLVPRCTDPSLLLGPIRLACRSLACGRSLCKDKAAQVKLGIVVPVPFCNLMPLTLRGTVSFKDAELSCSLKMWRWHWPGDRHEKDLDQVPSAIEDRAPRQFKVSSHKKKSSSQLCNHAIADCGMHQRAINSSNSRSSGPAWFSSSTSSSSLRPLHGSVLHARDVRAKNANRDLVSLGAR